MAQVEAGRDATENIGHPELAKLLREQTEASARYRLMLDYIEVLRTSQLKPILLVSAIPEEIA